MDVQLGILYLAVFNGVTTVVTHSNGGNVLAYVLLQSLTPGQRSSVRAHLFECRIMTGADSAWTESIAKKFLSHLILP